MTHRAWKSPLDAEMVLHGHRYGILVHFVKEALQHGMVKHMPREGPYLHNWNRKTDKPAFDESCIRCSLEQSIKHINRKGWEGLEWKGKGDES